MWWELTEKVYGIKCVNALSVITPLVLNDWASSNHNSQLDTAIPVITSNYLKLIELFFVDKAECE